MTRPRLVPAPRPDDLIKYAETIRQKAGFLCSALDSDMDLTAAGDRHELSAIADQIFTMAETILRTCRKGDPEP